jgi:hypothetical protein
MRMRGCLRCTVKWNSQCFPGTIRTGFVHALYTVFLSEMQSRTQSNACARARMALALGKLTTGTPKFRGSSSLSACTIDKRYTNHSTGKNQFPQSQCHPSPRTGISLGTRLSEMASRYWSFSSPEPFSLGHSLKIWLLRELLFPRSWAVFAKQNYSIKICQHKYFVSS